MCSDNGPQVSATTRCGDGVEDPLDLRSQLAGLNAQVLSMGKMAALGGLLSSLAHEINNPVNFVVTGLPSLRRDVEEVLELFPLEGRSERYTKLRGRIERLLDAIADGAERAAGIVRDIRGFYRLDAAEKKAADLHAGIESTLHLLEGQLKSGPVTVDRDFGDIPPVTCWAGQLNQVFMNLLVNAIQAIDGAGTITIRTRRSGDNEVSMAVKDSGCGMSEAVQARIFEPLYTTKEAGVGTGLGLSISREIVARHGGRIEVTSQPGGGTEFRVFVPIASDTQPATPAGG